MTAAREILILKKSRSFSGKGTGALIDGDPLDGRDLGLPGKRIIAIDR